MERGDNCLNDERFQERKDCGSQPDGKSSENDSYNTLSGDGNSMQENVACVTVSADVSGTNTAENVTGESILGIVDKLISEIAPNGNVLNLIIPSDDRDVGHRSCRDRDGASMFVKDETVSPKSNCSSKSPQQGHGPPSGPFVMGDQVDVVLDAYSSGENLGVPNNNGSWNCDSSSEFDHSSFMNQLDKYKWRSNNLATNSKVSLSRQQKVRTDLTLTDKVRLIQVSEATGKSQRSLAAEFHISVGSVNNILRRKREYKEAFENSDAYSRNHKSPRQLRSTKTQAPNELLVLVMRWLEVAKAKINPLTWPVVLEKVKEFATKMNVNTFSASATWLEELRHSLGIPLQALPSKVPTEHDARIAGSWRKMLPFLLQGYQPENVFCVAETTLYYRCLPDCCYIGGPLCQVMKEIFICHIPSLVPMLSSLSSSSSSSSSSSLSLSTSYCHCRRHRHRRHCRRRQHQHHCHHCHHHHHHHHYHHHHHHHHHHHRHHRQHQHHCHHHHHHCRRCCHDHHSHHCLRHHHHRCRRRRHHHHHRCFPAPPHQMSFMITYRIPTTSWMCWNTDSLCCFVATYLVSA
jgi:son of sevenless-like protein